MISSDNENLNKLVSVVVCAYNGERYLQQTLDSICRQSHEHIEIVIVDDGSTDATLEIIKKYQQRDKRIRLYIQPHRGFAAARNRAFQEANGEWIAIIDHDDLCYPERLEKQLLLSRTYPDADFIFSDTDYIDENNQVIDSQFSHVKLNDPYLEKGNAGILLLRLGGFIDSESVFIRKGIAQKYGLLDPKYLYAADYDFFVRLGFEVNFCFTREKLSAWRVHSSQATRNNVKKLNYEIIDILKRYLSDRRVDLNTKMYICLKILKIFVKTQLQKRFS